MGGPLGRGSAARRDPQGGALSPQGAGDPPAPTGTWGFHVSTGLRPAVLPQDSVSLPVRGRMEPCEVRTGQSDVRDASPGPRSPRAQWDHLPRPPGCLGSVVKRACTDARPHPAPRDSLRVFQKLSEIFSDENNYSLSRELLIKVRGGGERLSGSPPGHLQACLVWASGSEGSVCSAGRWPGNRRVRRLSQKGRVSCSCAVPSHWHPASPGLGVEGARGRHPFLPRPAQGWPCRACPGPGARGAVGEGANDQTGLGARGAEGGGRSPH